jgi:hypothetical protein
MREIDKTLNATYCTKEENLKIVSCQIAEPYPYLVLPLRLCLLALILFVCSREGSGKRERKYWTVKLVEVVKTWGFCPSASVPPAMRVSEIGWSSENHLVELFLLFLHSLVPLM